MNVPEVQLVRDQAPVKGIGGTLVAVKGKVKVALMLGEPPLSRTHYALFLVVKLPLNYSAILGRPILYDFKVVTSIRRMKTVDFHRWNLGHLGYFQSDFYHDSPCESQ